MFIYTRTNRWDSQKTKRIKPVQLCFAFVVILRQWLTYSGWLWIYCVAEDELETLILLPPPPKCWDYRCLPPLPDSLYVLNCWALYPAPIVLGGYLYAHSESTRPTHTSAWEAPGHCTSSPILDLCWKKYSESADERCPVGKRKGGSSSRHHYPCLGIYFQMRDMM